MIDREETPEAVSRFRSAADYSLPMAADHDRAVYSRYVQQLIPRTYLIAPDGRLCFAVTGFDAAELNALKRELSAQLASANSGSTQK